MNAGQSLINFNNQTSERNTKMESQAEVNRITDEMIKDWRSQIMAAASIGCTKVQAKSMAFDFIIKKYKLGELTSVEYAMFGNPFKNLVGLFPKPVTRKRKVMKQLAIDEPDNSNNLDKKLCSRCHKKKSFNDFNKDQSYCKQCQSEYHAERRSKQMQEKQNLSALFQTKDVEVESVSMTFTKNNMQVKYDNGEFLYSTVEGNQFTDLDVQDLLILRARAKSKVERINGSN